MTVVKLSALDRTDRQIAILVGAVALATADELSMVLTAVIRAERFGDGAIEAAFAKGVVQATARRAEVLVKP